MAREEHYTNCRRCEKRKPQYAKGLCHSCYGLALYYSRRGRPLPPYRERLRTCPCCSVPMKGGGDRYCCGTCRDTSAQRRRARQADRRLGPWRPWFGDLQPHECEVLERRLAGETHHAIGQSYGWTRQYNHQLEVALITKLRHLAALSKGAQ